MSELAPAAQVALCIMLPLMGICFFVMMGGGFEKRNKNEEE